MKKCEELRIHNANIEYTNVHIYLGQHVLYTDKIYIETERRLSQNWKEY